VNNPIVILSTSTRSGSTWLQRVLTSTGKVLVWGESNNFLYPFDDKVLSVVDPSSVSKEDLNCFQKQKAKMWMAHLQPFRADVLQAQKNLVEEVYGKTAEREGYSRWGAKETSWTEYIPQFVLSSWKEAQLVFLVRRFDDCFMSRFKDTNRISFGNHEADVFLFAKRWYEQTAWAWAYRLNPRCKVVRYEDLKKPANMKLLLNWLNLGDPDLDQCSAPISASGWQPWQDLRTFKPGDRDVMWEYRDRIRLMSNELGYETSI